MGHYVLTDCGLWLAQYDLGGDMNALALEYGAELADDTTFGSGGSRVRKGGLKTIDVAHEGYWNGGTGAVDDVLFGSIGVADVPMTIAPVDRLENSPAYAFLANLGEYAPGGEIGSMLAFSVSAEASAGPLVRGQLMVNRTSTSTANSGTAQNLGAVSATQRVYGGLHVIAASGTTPQLSVIVKSDDAIGFPSPTSRIAFGTKTAAAYEWASAAGSITDNFWRVDWTISGTTPSFTFVVVLGIA